MKLNKMNDAFAIFDSASSKLGITEGTKSRKGYLDTEISRVSQGFNMNHINSQNIFYREHLVLW